MKLPLILASSSPRRKQLLEQIGLEFEVYPSHHKILGKPKNKNDSYHMLKSLSGRAHKVVTGVHFSYEKYGIDRTINEQTIVSFNTLSDSDIYYYIDNYKPFDKAGSYGIQDWFSVQVKKVDGCYFNVMGLPLAAFFKEYRRIKKQLEIP